MSSPLFVWAADDLLGELVARNLEARGEPVLVLKPAAHASEAPDGWEARCRLAVVDPDVPGSFIAPIAEAVDEWGPPHGLAVLPPQLPARPFHEVAVSEWTAGVNAALHAVVLLLRAALPAAALSADARVVTVLPTQPAPQPHRRGGSAAGATLRGALAGLVFALADEPAGRHVRWFTVQGAAPGEGYDTDSAPVEARCDGPRATAALVGWLLTAPVSSLPCSNEIAVGAARETR